MIRVIFKERKRVTDWFCILPFRLPTRPQTPIIMIGPGTGLAPFRGFIQERKYLKDEGKPVGETILYFGCRKEKEDFIYRQELDAFVQDGVLKVASIPE